MTWYSLLYQDAQDVGNAKIGVGGGWSGEGSTTKNTMAGRIQRADGRGSDTTQRSVRNKAAETRTQDGGKGDGERKKEKMRRPTSDDVRAAKLASSMKPWSSLGAPASASCRSVRAAYPWVMRPLPLAAADRVAPSPWRRLVGHVKNSSLLPGYYSSY